MNYYEQAERARQNFRIFASETYDSLRSPYLVGQSHILSVQKCPSVCNTHDMALIRRLESYKVSSLLNKKFV